MNAFRLKKQLWRRWRRWKKALWVGAACVAVAVLAWRGMKVPEEVSGLLARSTSLVADTLGSLSDSTKHDEYAGNEPAAAVFNEGENGSEDEEAGTLRHEQLLQTIAQSGLSRTVHLKTTYVAGEEIQTLQEAKSPVQLKELIDKHPGWSGWLSHEGDLWLERKVDDLSPACKKEAYIGVDEHGNLTLFKGPPVQEEVLKTFFQMDMGSMKSSLPENLLKQLQDGIRIQDIEEYNSVLSTFSDYARDTAEQVMNSAQ